MWIVDFVLLLLLLYLLGYTRIHLPLLHVYYPHCAFHFLLEDICDRFPPAGRGT